MVKSTLKFASGTPNTLTFLITVFNSSTPLKYVSFWIPKFSNFSIFSSEVPSISIKLIILFICFSCNPNFLNSSITASLPIFSILSIILNISTAFSFCSTLSNSPFRILLLFIFIVKSSNPNSLNIV